MQQTCHFRSGPPAGGYATTATLILAALSAIVLVLISGCHEAPASNAFATTPADKASETRLRQRDTMPHLQPFDEHFVEVRETN